MGGADENALSAIQLSLASHVFREVLDKTIMAVLWLSLETLYRTKSPVYMIRLKECLYIFSMVEDTPKMILTLLFDLESLDVNLEDEDKTILLVVSLLASYKHFKEILLYSHNSTLSFEDVKTNLYLKKNLTLKFVLRKVKAYQ